VFPLLRVARRHASRHVNTGKRPDLRPGVSDSETTLWMACQWGVVVGEGRERILQPRTIPQLQPLECSSTLPLECSAFGEAATSLDCFNCSELLTACPLIDVTAWSSRCTEVNRFAGPTNTRELGSSAG